MGSAEIYRRYRQSHNLLTRIITFRTSKAPTDYLVIDQREVWLIKDPNDPKKIILKFGDIRD